MSADTGTAALPVGLTMCRTDAAANCLASPKSTMVFDAGAGATATFSVFGVGDGLIPFDAAVNRVNIRFTDAGGVTRGRTSVAIRTR